MKVLVIEDAVTSATQICHLLENMGLQAQHARDGETGLEIFKHSAPDLILLDVMLPGMDGFEVARRMRLLESDGNWTPIMFLSAKADDADVERGIEVGGDDYLIKPVSEVVFKSKVRALQRVAQMRHSLLLLTRKLNEANLELSRLSSLDGLTGIPNRRAFDDSLAREWGRAARQASLLTLMLIDIDHFKQYNDHYGHQAGDDCLRQVAQCLRHGVQRATDVVARYGGEEFALVLPDTTLEGAQLMADKLLQGVRALAIPHAQSATAEHVTISIGICVAKPTPGQSATWLSALEQADDQLYVAKAAGRNQAQWVVASSFANTSDEASCNTDLNADLNAAETQEKLESLAATEATSELSASFDTSVEQALVSR